MFFEWALIYSGYCSERNPYTDQCSSLLDKTVRLIRLLVSSNGIIIKTVSTSVPMDVIRLVLTNSRDFIRNYSGIIPIWSVWILVIASPISTQPTCSNSNLTEFEMDTTRVSFEFRKLFFFTSGTYNISRIVQKMLMKFSLPLPVCIANIWTEQFCIW